MRKFLVTLPLIFGALIIATPAHAATTTSTSTAKVDKLFMQLMTTKRTNPDYKVYLRPSGISAAKWNLLVRKVGTSTCGLIKAYDASETPRAAILDSYIVIKNNVKRPYSVAGVAYQIVNSISAYCPQYQRALDSI
jgi:hypothetical protein